MTTETSLRVLDLDGRPVGKAIETTAQRWVVPMSEALPRCALVFDENGGRLIDTATGAVFPAVVGSTTLVSSSDGCVRPVSDDTSRSAGDRLVTRDGIIVLPEGYEVRALHPTGQRPSSSTSRVRT